MSLNVVALISGGKDSFFTLLHCIQNGHNVVALANLYPSPPQGLDNAVVEHADINSFMYQTVGHSVIPLYSEALQLPLYRRHIIGSTVQTGRYYDASITDTLADETEDLIPLLQSVLRDHPEVNAVCSGAILSTYQRTRIESVALRLGLTPLAYLWQYPFLPPPSARLDSLTGLLEDMNAAGCDSRIIKVASGGMPEELLWADVTHSRTRSRIVESMALFFEGDESSLRGAVLGEGGEFETLALDGPPSVWKSRIEVDGENREVVSQEGGVRWLRVSQPRLVERKMSIKEQKSYNLVRIPGSLDPQFAFISVQTDLTSSPTNLKFPGAQRYSMKPVSLLTARDFSISDFTKSNFISIANLSAPSSNNTAAEQMTAIVSLLKATLANTSASPKTAQIVSTTLLLSSMSVFPTVNTAYNSLFTPGQPNPPARVTVASTLPLDTLVSLSCVICLAPPNTFRGLHVQSRSYWAPANIGPYSQAICTPTSTDLENTVEFAHLAGQIPLVPASMEIFHASFVDQAVLALQHIWRVGQERGVDLWPWGVAFLPCVDDDLEAKQSASIATSVWQQAHLTNVHGKLVVDSNCTAHEADSDDASAPDAWDLQNNRQRPGRIIPTVGLHRHTLPDHAIISTASSTFESSSHHIPPCITAEVLSLPRSAPIEWHSHGLAGLTKTSNNSKVSTSAYVFEWGKLCVLTHSTNTETDRTDADNNGEEKSTNNTAKPDEKQEKQQQQHLITLQIFASADNTSIHNPSIPELVARYLSPHNHNSTSSSSSLPRPGFERAQPSDNIDYSIVHGTAFLTSPATVGRNIENLPGVAIVPCRRVWGWSESAAAAAENGHKHSADADEGKEAAELQRLNAALTLRIDTYA